MIIADQRLSGYWAGSHAWNTTKLVVQSYADSSLKEIVKISPKEISVTRVEPNGEKNFWKANSYWAKIKLYPQGEIVENYLTLCGNNREIELGAYLSPNERTLVRERLETALNRVKSHI